MARTTTTDGWDRARMRERGGGRWFAGALPRRGARACGEEKGVVVVDEGHRHAIQLGAKRQRRTSFRSSTPCSMNTAWHSQSLARTDRARCALPSSRDATDFYTRSLMVGDHREETPARTIPSPSMRCLVGLIARVHWCRQRLDASTTQRNYAESDVASSASSLFGWYRTYATTPRVSSPPSWLRLLQPRHLVSFSFHGPSRTVCLSCLFSIPASLLEKVLMN